MTMPQSSNADIQEFIDWVRGYYGKGFRMPFEPNPADRIITEALQQPDNLMQNQYYVFWKTVVQPNPNWQENVTKGVYTPAKTEPVYPVDATANEIAIASSLGVSVEDYRQRQNQKQQEASAYLESLSGYLRIAVSKGMDKNYAASVWDTADQQTGARVQDYNASTVLSPDLPYYQYINNPQSVKQLAGQPDYNPNARQEFEQQQARQLQNDQMFRDQELNNAQIQQQQRVNQLPTAGDAYTGFLDKFMSPNMRRYFAGSGSDVFNEFNKANPGAMGAWQTRMATPDITTQYAKENLSQLQYVTQPQTEQMYADLVSPEERAAFQPQLDTLKQQRSNLESTISTRESQPRQIEQDPFSKYLSAYPFLNKYLSVSPSMRGESQGRYRQPTRLTR